MRKIISIVFCLAIVLCGCNEKTPIDVEYQTSLIKWVRDQGATNAPSVTIYWPSSSIAEMEYEMPVEITGLIADHDREFYIEQYNTPTSISNITGTIAVAGISYEDFRDQPFIVGKQEQTGKATIKLYHDPLRLSNSSGYNLQVVLRYMPGAELIGEGSSYNTAYKINIRKASDYN